MDLSKQFPAGVYVDSESLLNMRFAARDLSLEARKKSTALMEGPVRTRYKGRGMEFAEVRPYQAGDDIRTIDWRVTARMQEPYTKLFQEERERPVLLTVDQRSSMFFGSTREFKSVYAAKLAAIIGWTANAHNDRVGALVFGDHKQYDIRAKRTKHAVLDLINRLVEANRSLHSPDTQECEFDLYTMLSETARIAHPGSLVIVLSDFHDIEPRCVEALSGLGKNADVMAIHIHDPLERQLPAVTQLMISNGRERQNINAAAIRNAFGRKFDERRELIKQSCVNTGVTYVNCAMQLTAEQFATEIFSMRGARKNRSASAQAGSFQ